MFRVGDRVTHKYNPEFGIGTIAKKLHGSSYTVRFDKENERLHDGDINEPKHCWFASEIFLNKIGGNMKKEDLKSGDIVTLRNGDRLILADEHFEDLSYENYNSLCTISELDNNLKFEGFRVNGKNEDSDIVKVERPVKYETVFERDEEVQELTVDEISEKLGYKVKVVGEDR